ncbi:MAG: T9SS type A sorting domain-containing protein [Ignavibacteria bacterium]|nr:T9SS type A sorting domain-containing protein [Ignavibacteria bacterium]
MRVFCLALVFTVAGSVALCQNPSYEQKLYYSCKVWGFVKYYHSRVSNCAVDWDDVLLQTMPLIKNAATTAAFNDALDSLILAAGPMEIASTPSPDTLSPELTRNRNFSWMEDPMLRAEVRAKLHVIRDNFRPHEVCWVRTNYDSSGRVGWLIFPYDDPGVNIDASKTFPDEYTRVLMLFKYWNIMSYFNPNLYLTDTPWDSTLARDATAVATATTYARFHTALRQIAASLNDAHVTMKSSVFPTGEYSPKFILRFIEDGYRVVKSGYPELRAGDKITAINGVAMKTLEDSIRHTFSVGNPAALHSVLCFFVPRGNIGSTMRLDYSDSLNGAHSVSVSRYSNHSHSWFRYPDDSLSEATWRKWDCNVGYVNMGNLEREDDSAMYEDLKQTRAIIFDVRNIPNNTVWDLAARMFPKKLGIARWLMPDTLYPGTSFLEYDSAGLDDAKEPYAGRVIILCNEETWSHGEFSCMVLRAMPNAVVVGSQTMGADGNVSEFRLSRDLVTTFTHLGVYYPDGTQTQRIGIVPDSLVLPTANGIRTGRDEVLEKALEIAQCPVIAGKEEVPEPVPEEMPTLHSYPNPFSTSTTLTLSRSTTDRVDVKVYDVLGRAVLDLSDRLNETSSMILHHWELLSPGMYFCRMQIGKHIRTTVLCLVP